jgi:Tol biopolymer transport system component
MALVLGTKLGPYEIADPLGAGGMGEVYRARDTRLNRDVAIKVLPDSLAADEDRLRRFGREAQAAGALNHPNILVVFDVGTHDGAPYLVSELLKGETLGARLTRGPVPPSKAIDFARQIANGLAAAHEQGIIHRDIKPANLFVTADGRIKILDFGLAKQYVSAETDVTRAQSLTEAGVVLGTLGYMSPEQVHGHKTDARTDIFSFGAVLYEMLTGRRAFSGASPVETMHAILQSDPLELPAPALLASPALAKIVARCLEKDPAARFHSAHDLGLVLEAVATAPATGPAAVAPKQARWLTWSRVGLWAAIAAAGATAGALAVERFRTTPVVAPPTTESLTYSGHDASPAASPDGKTVAFTSDRDGVSRIWLKQVAGGGELALTEGPDDFPRFSPDGSTILFVRTTSDRSSLYRVALLGGDPHKLIDDVTSADWSPDGRQLAFTRFVSGDRSGSIVGVANADGSGSREVAFVAGCALVAPRWSPDSRMIAAVNGVATVSAGFGVELIDVAASHSRSLGQARPNLRQSSVVWTADSRAVIYSEADSIAAWMSGSSARLVRQDVTTGDVQVLLWVPNHSRSIDAIGAGRLLLDTRSSRENLREIPIGGAGTASRWLTRGNSTDRQPQYSPDGQWVTFSSNRGGNLDLWAVNRTTGVVRRLTDDPADDWDAAYSSDGRRLLFGSNRTGAYEIWTSNPDGSSPQQITHDGAFSQNPAETPDGKWLVYALTNTARPGLLRVGADGRGPLRLVDGAVQLPEISPDGQYVLYVDGLAARIRVVRLIDGQRVPFEIPIVVHKTTTVSLGRARWMPDSRGIAFVGQDEHGINGVFAQDFEPGRDTTATRRQLGGFDLENSAESLGISPDGKFLTVAGWEQLFNITIVSGVPGVGK